MSDLQTLEAKARRAKEANSFSEYQQGSASAEYKEYCEEAEELAAAAIKKLEQKNAPSERIDQVNYLLNRYKATKLSWLIDLYSNRGSVPSVMIAGASNFPTRKKERQNAREDSLYNNNPDYILDKIKSIGRDAGTIRSDEANAVERIKEKIERLENAPPDPWGYNKTEIRRLRSRLLTLAPEEFQEEQESITVNGVRTYAEIVKLWYAGEISLSAYDPDGGRYYFYLSLDFYNGKRHYKELLNFEIDKTGENMRRYDVATHTTKNIPLTDEQKYFLIINKISGSGNKAIMYQYFKSLAPSVQAAKEEAEEREASGEDETIFINGEEAKIIRNKEAVRLQLFFDGKPEAETRNRLKANGFRWAPSFGAWQRLLNNNAEYTLKRIAD